MRKWMIGAAVLAAVAAGAAGAGGMASSYRLDRGVVAVTNSQVNSSWVTVAVLVRFDTAATGMVAVKRESQGASYTLGACSFAGATNLVWVADRDYGFGFGDVLVVESTATNGLVQVMRRGE